MLPSNKNSDLKINNDNGIEATNNTNYENYTQNVSDMNNLLESSFVNIPDNIEQLNSSDNKSYYYQAIECLNNDISSVYDCIDNARVHLCMYSVNTSAKNPFLEFYLLKNSQNDIYPDILCFPSFFYYRDISNDILNESSKIQKMLLIEESNLTFKGYLLEEVSGLNDLYLFYEYKNQQQNSSENDIGSGEINRNDIVWKTVIDEIVNSRLVCNFPIDDIVTNFFLRNMQFMFLFKNNDKDNNFIYETPTVVYHGVNESMLYFKYIFGIPKTNYDEIMGPFYYFTDYENGVKMSIDSYNNKYNNTPNAEQEVPCDTLKSIFDITNANAYKKIGIIRSVIFLGVNKVPTNYPEDEFDNSSHSSILSSIDNENAQINRISDHNGLWTEKYDSVYIGKLLLDNGKFIKGAPLWVVKDYNQQSSLSYHYLSSKLLNGECSHDIPNYIL
jgi:hypothetical protein